MKMATMSICYMLLLVLLHIQLSTSNIEVTKVCMYTGDPTYCAQVLNSDSRTPTADLAGLGEISIDAGLVLATNISDQIIWLNNSASDARLQECFSTCFDLYDQSKDLLVNASAALNSKSYETMEGCAGSAGEFVFWCEDAFKKNPPRPSPLTVQNNNFYHLSQAMVVIANALQNGGLLYV